MDDHATTESIGGWDYITTDKLSALIQKLRDLPRWRVGPESSSYVLASDLDAIVNALIEAPTSETH